MTTDNLAPYRQQVEAKNATRVGILRHMLAEGADVDAVAARFGISRGGLNAWCNRRGLRNELAALRANDPIEPNQWQTDRLEDIEWMVSTGETLTGASARLGITPGALEKWCADNKVNHLAHKLRSREVLGKTA